MDQALHARAASRLEEALERLGALDPRDSYRAALRALKEARPDAFQDALRYYEEVLVPRVAAADSDALGEWRAYGLKIATLSGPGRVVAVDPTGRSSELRDPAAAGASDLVLYLPREPVAPVLVIAGPAEASRAQRACIDLLVEARVALGS